MFRFIFGFIFYSASLCFQLAVMAIGLLINLAVLCVIGAGLLTGLFIRVASSAARR